MYIAIAILAAIFAVNTTEKAVPLPQTSQQTAPAAPKAAPVLIDSRFSRKGEAAPWEKGTDPTEFLTSARTC